jgi:MFS family permease
LTNEEIALTTTFYALIAFSTSIVTGRLSDILATRKFFVVCGSITGAMTLSGLLVPNKLVFIIFRSISGLGFGMLVPSLVAMVSDKEDKIGNFSSFGSVGWALGVLISGILGLFWIPAIFVFGVLALVGSTTVAFTLQEDFSAKSKKLIEDNVLMVFWRRKSAYLSLGIRHSFASAIWTFWPLFLADLGADTFWIAIIQCTNALTQFIIMQIYTDRLRSERMIILGLSFSALAFYLFTLPANFWGIIPTQVILGISWAFLWVGSLRYSIEKSDFDRSTSAGILTSIQSISGILGPLIALLIISWGGNYVDIMIIATIATFVTLISFIFGGSSRKNHQNESG